MSLKKFLGAISLAAICGLSAAAQKITTDFDSSADFSKYHTFAIRHGQINSRNPALNSELAQKQLEDDLRRNLAARGLTEVQDNPDLNVFFHFGSAPRSEVQPYPAGWRGLRTQWVRVPYSEGTLVIDLRDTSTHALVWRGIAVEEHADPQKLREKFDAMVRKAVEKYPPKRK